MERKKHKATGCLWCLLEFTACVAFIVFLILKLCGSSMSWIAVFSPLIIGAVLTAMIFIMIFAQDYMEDE